MRVWSVGRLSRAEGVRRAKEVSFVGASKPGWGLWNLWFLATLRLAVGGQDAGLVWRSFGGEERETGEVGFGERFYRQNELGNPCRRSFGGEEREPGEVGSVSDFIDKSSLGVRFGEVSAVKLGKRSAQNVSCRRFKGKIQPTSRLHSKA